MKSSYSFSFKGRGTLICIPCGAKWVSSSKSTRPRMSSEKVSIFMRNQTLILKCFIFKHWFDNTQFGIKSALHKVIQPMILICLSRTFFANFCAREYAQRINWWARVGVSDLNAREWKNEIAISQSRCPRSAPAETKVSQLFWFTCVQLVESDGLNCRQVYLLSQPASTIFLYSLHFSQFSIYVFFQFSLLY